MSTLADLIASFFRRFSILLKLCVIGFLILLLLIPLSMVESVLNERIQRRNEAIGDITSTWGKDQSITGPVLVVPYQYTWKEYNGKKEEIIRTDTARACFLPAELSIEGKADSIRRARGIYEAIVYSTSLTLKGRFAVPDWDALKIDRKDVQWNDAYLALAINDLRGAKGQIQASWGGTTIPFKPGSGLPGFSSGIYAPLKGTPLPGAPIVFSVDLDLNGSSSLNFTPLGIKNETHLASNWPSPSFSGAYLPAQHQVSAGGFDANWQVSYYGRSYPQSWTSRIPGVEFNENTVAQSRYGVKFINLVDFYRNIERAIKYGILFVLLTFTAFFLFEVTGKLRIHMFQYILVGGALCLFYLALIALSEFLRFGCAYAVAAGACTLMISIYSLAFLKSGFRTLLMGVGLAGIYSFLYVILQLEDYSLLVGTIGLFIALGAVMYATRKIDWYEEKPQPLSPDLPPPLPARGESEPGKTVRSKALRR
ncbi:MAG: cell envelope integrity protein CreD [Methylacidiphilales bacterium]|nr:cell envelope integrity protein CreD [Candidatus Methylacidiphilales bacterium]